MVFKGRPQHAENTHYFMKIPIPRSLCGSKDTPKLDQFFKFKLAVVLTSMESKFGFPPHWGDGLGGEIQRRNPLR